MQGFLPICRRDMEERGWHELDFVFISGDAYVDHPSFGPAIICRLLEKHGYKVGIIPQPDWHTTKDFDRLGKPRLGFLVSAGNMDSLLNKFTAAKKVRQEDAYSPGGQAGHAGAGLTWSKTPDEKVRHQPPVPPVRLSTLTQQG